MNSKTGCIDGSLIDAAGVRWKLKGIILQLPAEESVSVEGVMIQGAEFGAWSISPADVE